MSTSYLFLAPGFEEIEALSVVDIMRRANIDVKMLSVTSSLNVEGAHGVNVKADALLSDTNCDNAEWVILPGGMPGASNLYANAKLSEILKSRMAAGRNVAAICASPGVVLGQLGVLGGRTVTVYPGFESLCEGAVTKQERVVVDGNLITSNGPSSATLFALAIVSATLGAETADKVAAGMLL